MSTPPAAPAAAESSLAVRDLFAAHLVAALIGAPKQPGVPRLDMDDVAKQAFEYADAMMRARVVAVPAKEVFR